MSDLVLPPADYPVGEKPPLVITLSEGIMLLGEREMMLEYVVGDPNPWRVRYRALRRGDGGPAIYYQHAFGPTWERAIGAALGRTVIERTP